MLRFAADYFLRVCYDSTVLWAILDLLWCSCDDGVCVHVSQ